MVQAMSVPNAAELFRWIAIRLRRRLHACAIASAALLIGGCIIFQGDINNASNAKAALVAGALHHAWTYSKLGNLGDPPKPPWFEGALKPTPPSPSFALGDPGDLRTFTPYAAIRGNQVVIVGGALDPPAINNGSLLIRESDSA